MEKPDQTTINSLFETIEQSDNNASVTIEVLSDEYDLSNLKRVVTVPEEQHKITGEKVVAQDPLDIYLHSVYHNATMCLNLFLDMRSDNTTVSAIPEDNNAMVMQFSKSLGTPLLIENGNDVCWAILSDHDDALKNLQKAYNEHNLEMKINDRTAIPINNINLRNEDAKQHTPLDLAVMLYVAEKREDIKIQKTKGKITEAIKEQISPILEQFGSVGKVGAVIQDSEGNMKINAPSTADNIRLLLSMGAQGSIASYFPASEETLDNPFSSDAGLEVKSLRAFCEENANLFAPDLFANLTNQSTMPILSK